MFSKDPWKVGGVQWPAGPKVALGPTVVSIMIADGAHHQVTDPGPGPPSLTHARNAPTLKTNVKGGWPPQDLRFTTPLDPPSVAAAKAQEFAVMRGWIEAFHRGGSEEVGAVV